MSRIEMHLLDGRVFDLSGLSPDEAVTLLKREHITFDQIRETRHYLTAGAIPAIVCPQCGMRSYNPNDIRERYCGNCRSFHDELPHRP